MQQGCEAPIKALVICGVFNGVEKEDYEHFGFHLCPSPDDITIDAMDVRVVWQDLRSWFV